MAVQNRLKELVARKERLEGRKSAYTYGEIAEATGVDYRTVSAWMKNDAVNFTGRVIKAFCDWLNVSVGELLILEPIPSQNEDDPGQFLPIASHNVNQQPAMGM